MISDCRYDRTGNDNIIILYKDDRNGRYIIGQQLDYNAKIFCSQCGLELVSWVIGRWIVGTFSLYGTQLI